MSGTSEEVRGFYRQHPPNSTSVPHRKFLKRALRSAKRMQHPHPRSMSSRYHPRREKGKRITRQSMQHVVAHFAGIPTIRVCQKESSRKGLDVIDTPEDLPAMSLPPARDALVSRKKAPEFS